MFLYCKQYMSMLLSKCLLYYIARVDIVSISANMVCSNAYTYFSQKCKLWWNCVKYQIPFCKNSDGDLIKAETISYPFPYCLLVRVLSMEHVPHTSSDSGQKFELRSPLLWTSTLFGTVSPSFCPTKKRGQRECRNIVRGWERPSPKTSWRPISQG